MAEDAVPEFVCSRPAAVLGDIHGSLEALEQLLPQLSGRDLFVIGDICDRGSGTKQVIELLIRHKARGVLGNHEQWFRQWVFEGVFKGLGIGSSATLASYGVSEGNETGAHGVVPESHRAWLGSLEHVAGLTVFEEKFWMVHAGVAASLVHFLRPNETVSAVVPRLYRERDYYAHWNNAAPEACLAVDRPVIMGHKSLAEPLLRSHVLAIDTGAGSKPNGRLSALLLPERRTLSVPAPGG